MKRLPALAATLALGTAFTTQAHALEADAFAERLKAAFEAQSLTLAYNGATVDGEDVVLSNLKLGVQDLQTDDELPNLTFEEVRFEDVTETDGGGYRVGRVGRNDVSYDIPEIGPEDEQASFTIAEWAFEGITIPGTEPTGPLAPFGDGAVLIERAFLNDMQFKLAGEDYVSLASAEYTTDVSDTTLSTSGSFTDMVVDLSVSADRSEDLKEWIDGTGISSLNIDAETDSTWNLETGALDQPTFRVALDGLGSANLEMSLGGVTSQFAQAAMDIGEQMENATAQQQQALGLQMMGLAAQLQFGGVEFTYDDDGLGDKIIPYYAEIDGQSKEELVQEVAAVLPRVLSQLQAPELQAQIEEAVTSFLNDPQSFTVSLKPDAPVPFAALAAAATQPAQLFQALNAQVNANSQ